MCGWVECLASSWTSCAASFPLSLTNVIATVRWVGLFKKCTRSTGETLNLIISDLSQKAFLMQSGVSFTMGQIISFWEVACMCALQFCFYTFHAEWRSHFIWISLSYFRCEPSCMRGYHLKGNCRKASHSSQIHDKHAWGTGREYWLVYLWVTADLWSVWTRFQLNMSTGTFREQGA